MKLYVNHNNIMRMDLLLKIKT